MATVFISYNRESEATTKALADDIEALGHTVWFDKDVSGGQAWWDQILSKIRDSDIFVFVLDTEALNSTACKREYGYAAELGKPILPILAASDVSTSLLPPALSKIQFIDYRNADREAAFRLARAFTTIPPPAALPDPLPTPPEAPISYLGNLAEQVSTSASISYEKQCAVLLDLRRGLRDPNTATDVKVLLNKFRKRNDLFATIAEEIDELLALKRKVPIPPIHTSEPEPTIQNLARTPQPKRKTEITESGSQDPQEKASEDPNVNVSDLAHLSGISEREQHELKTNSAEVVTSRQHSSTKRIGSFIKAVFATIGVLSLLFLLFTLVNFDYRGSNVAPIKIFSLLYYGLAAIVCLFGLVNFPISIKMIRGALVIGIITGVGMIFWTFVMDGHMITFDEISPAWIATTIGYGVLSWVVFSKLKTKRSTNRK